MTTTIGIIVVLIIGFIVGRVTAILQFGKKLEKMEQRVKDL